MELLTTQFGLVYRALLRKVDGRPDHRHDEPVETAQFGAYFINGALQLCRNRSSCVDDQDTSTVLGEMLTNLRDTRPDCWLGLRRKIFKLNRHKASIAHRNEQIGTSPMPVVVRVYVSV